MSKIISEQYTKLGNRNFNGFISGIVHFLCAGVSNHTAQMSRTPSGKTQAKEPLSEEMMDLLKSRSQVRDWAAQVEKRLYEMEDTYLKETPFGNVIRGFEVEGGTRSRGERGRGN